MFDPEVLVARLGGLARGVRLQEYGISRGQLSKAVQSGRLERLRPGVFATTGLCDAVSDAARHGGALTCAHALRQHGVWVMTAQDGPPHVWLGRRGRAHAHVGCRCTSHYFRGRTAFGTVDVETALVHLYHCEGAESFFASFESAWRRGKLSRAARGRIGEALPARARWMLAIARPDADSGLESLLRLRLHMLGISLECQVVIIGVGKVDFVIGGRLILEADGRENHEAPDKRHKDLKRDAAASRLGYETLRFDYAQLIHDWASVQAAILGALRRLREHA